jgi:hypothetical protein
MSQNEAHQAKRIIRAEMARRGIGYIELSAKLAEQGVVLSEKALRSKVSRGAFTADVFLQCLAALGVETLRLTD